MDALPVKYERTETNGRFHHIWSAKDERGGVHIWANLSEGGGREDRWIGGCESHTPATDENPGHVDCWLLEGPCNHDGSSLMFSEGVADMLPSPFGDNPDDMPEHSHRYVESKVRYLHRVWFAEREED